MKVESMISHSAICTSHLETCFIRLHNFLSVLDCPNLLFPCELESLIEQIFRLRCSLRWGHLRRFLLRICSNLMHCRPSIVLHTFRLARALTATTWTFRTSFPADSPVIKNFKNSYSWKFNEYSLLALSTYNHPMLKDMNRAVHPFLQRKLTSTVLLNNRLQRDVANLPENVIFWISVYCHWARKCFQIELECERILESCCRTLYLPESSKNL